MHCPYCKSFNADHASFCVSCGRSLVSQPQNGPRPSSSYGQQPSQPSQPSQFPSSQRQPQPPARPPVQPAPRMQPATPVVPPKVVAPEPPVPFPPRTIAQLQALMQGALPYTLVSEIIGNGRRKTVRIVYARTSAWQQVATLLKALKEYNMDKFDTVIVQGVFAQETDVYNFTNGQLCFECNVRLGDHMLTRYQIETGNGFSSDSLRIVLSEE